MLALIAILLSSHGFPFCVINPSSTSCTTQLSISCTAIPYFILSSSYIFCTRSVQTKLELVWKTLHSNGLFKHVLLCMRQFDHLAGQNGC